MNKTVQILLIVSGVGLAIWLISKLTPKQGQTVIVPTASTGTASPFENFYNAFRRVPTSTVGVRYDNTGEKIKAVGGIIKELPGIFKGFGDAWKSWSGTTPTTTTASAGADYGGSYEDYYATNGYR